MIEVLYPTKLTTSVSESLKFPLSKNLPSSSVVVPKLVPLIKTLANCKAVFVSESFTIPFNVFIWERIGNVIT